MFRNVKFILAVIKLFSLKTILTKLLYRLLQKTVKRYNNAKLKSVFFFKANCILTIFLNLNEAFTMIAYCFIKLCVYISCTTLFGNLKHNFYLLLNLQEVNEHRHCYCKKGHC